ncbi:unnamed protein product [Angiostrongylus costaricensis]|uniref:Protein kinase domain-containing protein n=1 Tax=Angiostrongylus costaricensis TaxID=334426 RepID=A0A0R3PFX3_ANGCS|nr:unnamed protein product [Angiostrongylus costaricensis]
MQCGYIHRDIKPTNFVIGREQDGDLHTIFIIDFGLSRRYRYLIAVYLSLSSFH